MKKEIGDMCSAGNCYKPVQLECAISIIIITFCSPLKHYRSDDVSCREHTHAINLNYL